MRFEPSLINFGYLVHFTFRGNMESQVVGSNENDGRDQGK